LYDSYALVEKRLYARMRVVLLPQKKVAAVELDGASHVCRQTAAEPMNPEEQFE